MNEQHPGPRVYRVRHKTAYCVCDTCGATWYADAEESESLPFFANQLADALDNAERLPPPDGRGRPGVFIDERTAEEIAEKLRRLAGR